MEDRERILKADDLVAELRGWLAIRGLIIDRYAMAPDGDAVTVRIKKLPEDGKSNGP